MKTAFLFPGQGAQIVGMGKDLYEEVPAYKQMFDECARGADLNLASACFAGEGMDEGEIVQPAIFAHTMGLLHVLRQAGVEAKTCAGLSLGEYSALCAAGVFTPFQCAALVRRRGRIMDAAFPKNTAGMLSVIGLTLPEVEALIGDGGNVTVANHLSDTQIVIAGYLPDLSALTDGFKKAGAKMAVLLNVRGPSHTPLLKEAAEAFTEVLRGEAIGPLGAYTVYSGVLGAPYQANADVKLLLAQQMQSRLRWHDCVEHMLLCGVERFVEIGPSNVLSKLVKRRAGQSAAVISVHDKETLTAFLAAEGGSR